eukprot:23634-Eustigmatos_ZCMA.PRE.1
MSEESQCRKNSGDHKSCEPLQQITTSNGTACDAQHRSALSLKIAKLMQRAEPAHTNGVYDRGRESEMYRYSFVEEEHRVHNPCQNGSREVAQPDDYVYTRHVEPQCEVRLF